MEPLCSNEIDNSCEETRITHMENEIRHLNSKFEGLCENVYKMTEGLQKFQTEFISYMRRDNPSLLENSAAPLTHAQQGHIEINDPHDADAPPVSVTSTESSTHGLAERISSNADFIPDPGQPVVSDPTVPAYRYGRQNYDARGPHLQFCEDVPRFTPTQRSRPVDTPLYTDENRQPPPTGFGVMLFILARFGILQGLGVMLFTLVRHAALPGFGVMLFIL
ncbi:uncharacterized protein LOC106176423, partial [Lingula anatina]|uniref:Uncharacterized protein LOC106176423 n=1 Tax=Lingula anatina TaxID=7574 RepID=A0A1S3JV84_LINAN